MEALFELVAQPAEQQRVPTARRRRSKPERPKNYLIFSTTEVRISSVTSAIVLILSSRHGFTSTTSRQTVFGFWTSAASRFLASSGVKPFSTGVPVPREVRSGSIESTSNDT